jgi:serine/threonine protein phosphatase PrpC
MTEIKYDVIGKSITGASHTKSNLPNQDSVACFGDNANGKNFVFGIVSDGHGSKKCFRSHLGSAFATEVLSEIFFQFAESIKEDTNQQSLKQYVIDELPKMIVESWREKVNEHLENYPYSNDDLQILSVSKTDFSSSKFLKAKYLPYGATLIGVLMHKKYVVYVQLGDGDILIATEEGEVHRRLKEDERLLGNETTSLCLETAQNDFRTAIDFIVESPPHFIMISTDGFANAYKEDVELFKFPTDVSKLHKEKGFEYLKNNLSDWLEETSVQASGDDTTMCILVSNKIEVEEKIESEIPTPKPKEKGSWKNIITNGIDKLKNIFSKSN